MVVHLVVAVAVLLDASHARPQSEGFAEQPQQNQCPHPRVALHALHLVQKTQTLLWVRVVF